MEGPLLLGRRRPGLRGAACQDCCSRRTRSQERGLRSDGRILGELLQNKWKGISSTTLAQALSRG